MPSRGIQGESDTSSPTAVAKCISSTPLQVDLMQSGILRAGKCWSNAASPKSRTHCDRQDLRKLRRVSKSAVLPKDQDANFQDLKNFVVLFKKHCHVGVWRRCRNLYEDEGVEWITQVTAESWADVERRSDEGQDRPAAICISTLLISRRARQTGARFFFCFFCFDFGVNEPTN